MATNNIGTITNSGTGSGSTLISAIIGASVTNVIQNSATSQLNLSGVNTFTGTGLTIKSGTVLGTTSASAFGAGNITLGDTTGTASATLLEGTTGLTIARVINRSGAAALNGLPRPAPLSPAEVCQLAAQGSVILDVRAAADFGAGPSNG